MSFLFNLQLEQRPAFPILLGARLAASPGTFVSPSIGFAAILESVAILGGGSPAFITAAHILISRDNDISDPDNLVGEPLWIWTGDILVAGRRWPTFDHVGRTLVFHPRRRITAAPFYLKARLDVSVLGADYAIVFRLLPTSGLTTP